MATFNSDWAKRLAREEALERARRLEDMDESMASGETGTGRPPIVLYPEYAQRMLRQLERNESLRKIERKHGVSARWIGRAVDDGRLTLMAEGRYGTPNHPRP